MTRRNPRPWRSGVDGSEPGGKAPSPWRTARRRNGRGESIRGFIRQRSEGSWTLEWKVQDPTTGKWATTSKAFRGNKKQADAELTKIVNSLNAGDYVEPNRLTMRALCFCLDFPGFRRYARRDTTP